MRNVFLIFGKISMKNVSLILLIFVISISNLFSEARLTLSIQNRTISGSTFSADIYVNVPSSTDKWFVAASTIAIQYNAEGLDLTNLDGVAVQNFDSELSSVGYTCTQTDFGTPYLAVNLFTSTPSIYKTGSFRLCTIRWNINNTSKYDSLKYDGNMSEVYNGTSQMLTFDCNTVSCFKVENPTPMPLGSVAPTITSFTPTTGAEGTSVTITGTNFTGATSVKFGGTAAANFTVNSATQITATVGTGSTGTISVATAGGTGTSSGTFTFIPAPTITSFTPTTGGTGTSVTITGTNFTGATSVKFGGTAATTFTVNSATQITATVGTGTTGTITVTTAGGTGTSSGTFTYIPAPTITSFTPTTGGAGTSVTITGTNFIGTSSVKFGGTEVATYVINSATQLSVTVGSGSTGTITVTTAGGTGTSTGTFTFIPAPAITSFTPTTGGAGTSVTITGTNFTGATSVKFGGTAAANFTVNSGTQITATVGTGSTGTITVTTAGGTGTSSTSFTFISAPTITSFTPTSGPSGTVVTIAGTNFTGATSVKFGGTAAANFTVNSATQITATVGTGSTGTITVTTAGGTGTSAATFTFVVVPTLSTTAITNITNTTAASGGNITADGGANVTGRGVCWSTTQNPTIANSKTTDGTGTGSFISNITGLTQNTTYFVRAYAVNSAGTAYGDEKSFKTTQEGGLTVTINSNHYYDNMICINEEILFTPTISKTGTFTYSWKINNVASGTASTLKHTFTSAGQNVISLTVIDQNNESGTGTLTITITDQCPVTVFTNDFETCKNSTPTITPVIFGGKGTYTYNWTPASDFVNNAVRNGTVKTPSYSKEFKIVATDPVTNQQGSAVSYMTVMESPSVSFDKAYLWVKNSDPVDLTKEEVLKVTVSGGVFPYQYKWMNNNGVVIDATSIYPPMGSSKYLLVVTDAKGCTSLEKRLTIFRSNGKDIYEDAIPGMTGIGFMFTYPNPVTDNVSVYADFNTEMPATLKIFNLLGKEVYSMTIDNTQVFESQINLSTLTAGVYTFVIQTSENTFVKQFVKQ
jgi:hypothetical protein